MIFKRHEIRYIRSVTDKGDHVYFPAENIKLNANQALYVYANHPEPKVSDPDDTLTQTLFDDTPRHIHKWNL